MTPISIQDVSLAVQALTSLNTANNSEVTFAVREGGYTPFAGSANINNGVTIDLRSIRGIDLSLDQKITSIEGGTIWRDVYQKLSKDLMVSGGRVSNIGIG